LTKNNNNSTKFRSRTIFRVKKNKIFGKYVQITRTGHFGPKTGQLRSLPRPAPPRKRGRTGQRGGALAPLPRPRCRPQTVCRFRLYHDTKVSRRANPSRKEEMLPACALRQAFPLRRCDTFDAALESLQIRKRIFRKNLRQSVSLRKSSN
jgi:hypothetical protein